MRTGHSLSQVGGLITWHDAWLLAAHAPAGSPLATVLDPRLAWTPTDWWMQSVEYSLRWLVWSKTKDGQKNRRRPEPRPAPKAPKETKADPNLMVMDTTELDAFLKRPRTAISESKTLLE